MTLCDTGPMVALVNDRDAQHASCVNVLRALPSAGLVTTWACMAEAMYLLGRAGGWRPQEKLWEYVSDGLLRVHVPRAEELERMLTLMRKYSDTPMDFADASLVAASETLDERRVFTTDNHFYVYRQQQGQAFDDVP